MSKIELIDAYVRGDIDRRSFMRKLAAVGVSATAAAAYAGSLASGASASTGFVARAQDDDDYGVGDLIEQLIASIVALIRSILDSIFGGFFGASDFEQAGLSDRQVAQLRQMSTKMDDQAAALDGLFGTASAPKVEVGGSLNELLAQLAAQFNRYTAALARVAPTLEQAAARELVTSAGFSASRQAAVANELAGGEALTA